MKFSLSPYAKNEILESKMKELNEILLPIQEEISKGIEHPKRTIVFLLGLPRSGHTLLAQLMITRFYLAYPTNFVAKLWKAPGLAARLQKLVLEPAMRDYHSDFFQFESDQGLTHGIFGIHEFGYFWREILNFGETHALSDEEWKRVNKEKLIRLVASLEFEFGDLPVLFKNGQLIFQAFKLAELFPKSVFLCCLRNPLYVAQSLVIARQKRFGNKREWFSFRPPEYIWLKDLPWWEQVAGQVVYIQYHLEKQMEKILSERVLWLYYEEICDNPRKVMKIIEEFVSRYDRPLKIKKEVPDKFVLGNNMLLPKSELELLKKSLKKFERIIKDLKSITKFNKKI